MLASNTCLSRMPVTGDKLSEEDEGCLLEWIESIAEGGGTGGASEGGASQGGAPEGGAPEGGAPVGGAPAGGGGAGGN